MQKKALVGTVFVLIALILIGLSLTMPWFSTKSEYPSSTLSEDQSEDYYLDHIEGGTSGFKIKVEYDNDQFKDYNFVQTFQTTQIIVIVGLICGIFGLIGAAMVSVGKLSSKMGTLLVLLTVILVIIAPIYLMFTLPGAFKEDFKDQGSSPPSEKIETDFFGSATVEEEELFGGTITYDVSWGGGLGWFLAIIAMVMCVIALPLVAKSKPAVQPGLEPQPQLVAVPPPVGEGISFQPEGAFTPIAPPGEGVSFQPEPTFSISEPTFSVSEPAFAPTAGPSMQPVAPPTAMAILPPELASKGDQFQCPDCSKIFILAPGKRPAVLNCPYCGLKGIVD